MFLVLHCIQFLPCLCPLNCCSWEAMLSISRLVALMTSVSVCNRDLRSNSTALFSFSIRLIVLPFSALKSSNALALGGGELRIEDYLFYIHISTVSLKCSQHLSCRQRAPIIMAPGSFCEVGLSSVLLFRSMLGFLCDQVWFTHLIRGLFSFHRSPTSTVRQPWSQCCFSSVRDNCLQVF